MPRYREASASAMRGFGGADTLAEHPRDARLLSPELPVEPKARELPGEPESCARFDRTAST